MGVETENPQKIAIVTGANSGLGLEITKGLTARGIRVIMACRDVKKAELAKSNLIEVNPNAQIEVIQLDLGSLSSVRKFAQTFAQKHNQLHMLIENAGIMIPPFAKTEDGFESQMGVNYFGHFLLTKLLMPILSQTQGARIGTTSSIAHINGRINFENLNSEKSYSKIAAYGQSKLACLMFAYELQRRLEQSNSQVIAVSAHPGVSKTNLFAHIPKLVQILMTPFLPLFTHTPDKAALPMLHAMLDKDVKGGEYFGPKGFNGMKGPAGKVKSMPHSHDIDVAKKLWERSEELIGEKFDI